MLGSFSLMRSIIPCGWDTLDDGRWWQQQESLRGLRMREGGLLAHGPQNNKPLRHRITQAHPSNVSLCPMRNSVSCRPCYTVHWMDIPHGVEHGHQRGCGFRRRLQKRAQEQKSANVGPSEARAKRKSPTVDSAKGQVCSVNGQLGCGHCIGAHPAPPPGIQPAAGHSWRQFMPEKSSNTPKTSTTTTTTTHEKAQAHGLTKT